jgi:hypothetical protein
MDREKAMRESERAAVERWFAPSPLGPMFDVGDGRMLRIAPDAIPAWRDRAFARIEAFIVASRPPPRELMFCLAFLFAGLVTVLQIHTALRGEAIAALMAGGAVLWHAVEMLKVRDFRRDLRGLRGEIAASLALSTPLPAEFGARFRRRNPWRTALQIWVWSVLAAALASLHFVPAEAIDRGPILAALGATGVAWLLHFAARHVDRVQAKTPALASRPTPPISRP